MHTHTPSHKHLHWEAKIHTLKKAPEVIFLSNYNLPKNVENLLLDEVVFRVEKLGGGRRSTEVTEVFKVWFFQKGNLAIKIDLQILTVDLDLIWLHV